MIVLQQYIVAHVSSLRNRPALAGKWVRHIMEPMDTLDWYKVEQLPWPADWATLFGREGPLMVEIGFGSGLFLVDMARRNLQANIVGLEIALPSIRNAARKIAKARLTNVSLLQADAVSVLHVLCAPGSVTDVVINFPDPWPKKNHLARRLIDDDFLCLLATRMRRGSRLDIATDHVDYAAQITACLQRSPHFISTQTEAFTHVDEDRVQTKYQQVGLVEGRVPYFFKWQRNHIEARDRFPIPKELPMPHVVLRMPADTAEIGRLFRPAVIERESTRVRFVEAYQSLHDGKILIETYINEGPIMQRIGLQVRRRATGEIVISLAEIGFPRPTHGVHLAISSLVQWLRREFPSLVVVQTTLQGEHADTPYERDRPLL